MGLCAFVSHTFRFHNIPVLSASNRSSCDDRISWSRRSRSAQPDALGARDRTWRFACQTDPEELLELTSDLEEKLWVKRGPPAVYSDVTRRRTLAPQGFESLHQHSALLG